MKKASQTCEALLPCVLEPTFRENVLLWMRLIQKRKVNDESI
jgi:hypothetical protein